MLLGADDLTRGVVVTLGDRVVLLLHRTPNESDTAPSYGLVGNSSRIRAVRASIEKAATSDVPVLLRGETGTGKELVARAIASSDQRAKPYVTVNMSAVTPEMASAEFFGVQRNSATGVDAREGYFAAARGGTLFLDEVGLAHVQVLNALLRALDGGELQRVGAKGSNRPRADVRLISATDTNLERAINQGTFSQAILQRLGGYPILLPALRERRDDVGLLLIHFLSRELEKLGARHLLDYEPAQLGWLRAPLVARIARYSFPGNVRELRNLAQALAIHSSTLPEARLPDDWERCLEACPTPASNWGPDLAAEEHVQRPSAAPRGSSTLPPGAVGAVSGASGSLVPPGRSARSVTDDEFRTVARRCRYSKSAMAKELAWDRRAVDTRWNAIGMRSVKEISEGEFAEAVRKCGLDWDTLADVFGVSRKSLQDRFAGANPDVARW
jgi:DNA-binding NtrC family response regulator